MAYRYLRDSAHVHEEPQETPLGFKFIGNRQMQDGEFEPEETRLVQALLPSVDIVINVGANIGYYCCIALRADKYVVAFEPMHLNLSYLLPNIRANGWDSRIEVFPLALSNTIGVIEIYGGGTGASLVRGWAGATDKTFALVPCSTMDTVLAGRFQGRRTLIIVDVEGAELAMLGGATSYLEREPKPVWMIEISISTHQPKGTRINPNLLSTFQLFWDRGYEAWTADGQCQPVTPAEIQSIVECGENSLHTHNFLFLEKAMRQQILLAPAGSADRST